MPIIDDPNAVALLVRVQNLEKNAKTIYDVGPSLIALTRNVDNSLLKYTKITENDILIDLSQEYQSIGVEDPRLVLDGNVYYVWVQIIVEKNDCSISFSFKDIIQRWAAIRMEIGAPNWLWQRAKRCVLIKRVGFIMDRCFPMFSGVKVEVY